MQPPWDNLFIHVPQFFPIKEELLNKIYATIKMHRNEDCWSFLYLPGFIIMHKIRRQLELA